MSAGNVFDSVTDFASSAFDTVSSFTDSFGTEFLSADTFSNLADSFTTSVSDVAGSLYETVGSFAGNATWFDTFNPGSIVNSAITTVTDFGSNIVSGVSLPSISVPGLTNPIGYGTLGTPGFAGPSLSIPGLVNSTVASLAGPVIRPVTSILSGSGFGINTGYGSTATPGFAGPSRSAPGLVNSTISNLASLPSQLISGTINTTARAVNATLGALVGPVQAAPVTSFRTSAAPVSLTTGLVADTAFVDTGTGLLTLPEDIPVRQEGNELVDLNTGEVLAIDEEGFVVTDNGLRVLPEDRPVEQQGDQLVDLNTGEVLAIDEGGFVVTDGGLRVLPEDLPAGDTDQLIDLNTGEVVNTDAGFVQGLVNQARQQQTIREQRQNKAAAGDWRVRLRLAPNSTYLYNAADCGPVLWPLRNTDGVIFPYTPQIDMAYKANYDAYDLTHSNYRGYFYRNSAIDAVNLRATFTAQDTSEANYLLAVIHFFRSVTKMFYGQDAERGSPPPLTYLSGLGDFQFNEHPCVVAQFNYTLPNDVDYIRAQSSQVNGTNLLAARNRQTVAGNPLSYAINRLASVGLPKGGLDVRAAAPTLGLNNPTYVPTKMEISLTLLPIQSRQQVSKQFSVKNFANGNLLRGGFW